jgi:FMN phosphatase YigB (HAD superfamily)
MADSSQIDTIFLMLGGVATQGPEVVISRVLAGYQALEQPAGRIGLRDLSTDLELGRLDEAAFSRRVLQLGRVELEGGAEALWTHVREALAPTPGLHGFLDEVKRRYCLWLISDYPRRWTDELLDLLNLRAFFQQDCVLFPAALHLPRLMPYLIPTMLTASGTSLEQCLFVDARAANTAAAIRNGLNAAVFVDVPRLRRNLVLRSML